jgi:hypothetical protein
VMNHPTLMSIDFSNNEKNINKNKLKNNGALAIVEGILESEGSSMISEINLSYNMLTSECLPGFGMLCNPNFIQLRSLNLSYNELGPDTIHILGPILSSVVELNLASCKLNNQTMQDFAMLFRKQEMELRVLDLHSN